MGLREELFTALDQWHGADPGMQLEVILPIIERHTEQVKAAAEDMAETGKLLSVRQGW